MLATLVTNVIIPSFGQDLTPAPATSSEDDDSGASEPTAPPETDAPELAETPAPEEEVEETPGPTVEEDETDPPDTPSPVQDDTPTPSETPPDTPSPTEVEEVPETPAPLVSWLGGGARMECSVRVVAWTQRALPRDYCSQDGNMNGTYI